ncbi:Peptidase family M23 [Oceanobacillus limi]|uniref:Peptidase family M23 n=1 Tax=Oceanobacillus limi TaxID=930131 RepID=A0A1I0BU43_9BACI|nr:peptidoglycan DD-metalloendopeptidase family protein [Oceanobacillus limi]SET09902.1 Peptidase family M23 [Oceanobacillus limi]
MKKLLPFLLIAALVLSASNIHGDLVSAESKNLDELKKEKSEIEKKQKDLESEKSDTEKKLEENKEKQNSVQSDINSLDQQLADTQASIQSKQSEIDDTNKEIDDLGNKIEELKEEIEELKEEIKELEEKIEKREALLKDRLRAIQKNGGTMRYIEVLLGSSSFADFISRTAAVNVMMDQDKAIMESLNEDRITVENKKTQVEDNKTEVEAKKVEVEDKKLALENQKEELVALQGQLDQQMAEKESLMAQLEEEHEHLEEIELTLEEEQEILRAEASAKQKAIAMAERELEQLNKNDNEQASSGNPNGIFIHPANGRISSQFGMRYHPIKHVNKLHSGTDFAVGTGTALKAPADGVVSRAAWVGGFGNAIFISHYIDGQSYTTVSAHLSSMSVSPGQEVKQGQVIGRTGNTGNSTGPHLHFEVHIGGYGNPVDPMKYLR